MVLLTLPINIKAVQKRHKNNTERDESRTGGDKNWIRYSENRHSVQIRGSKDGNKSTVLTESAGVG